MGLIAEVLQFFRGTDDDAEISESKGELGGGDVVTSVNYMPAGYDAFPLTSDYMLLVPGPEAGTFLVAGYLDPLNAGTAREGEISLYLRDANGAVQGELFLAESEPDWKTTTAGALIARADRTDAALNALAETFNSHKHGYTGGGTASGPLSSTTPASDPAGASPIEQSTDHAVGADKGWVT